MSGVSSAINEAVTGVYRSDWGRILATVIRLVGDFDIAEEATQEAFEAALGTWREGELPEHPRAWLIQTARNMAIDRVRRRKRFAGKLEELAQQSSAVSSELQSPAEIPDDRLRLIFTCCHPALAP